MVRSFNKAVEIVTNAQTATFHLGTSIFQESWDWHVAKILQRYGYSITTAVRDDYKFFVSARASVNMYWIYYLWYKNGKKEITSENLTTDNISSDMLLHLLIGDGSANSGGVRISTQAFTFQENKFLANLLEEKLGIKVNVGRQKNPRRPGEHYYFIQIKRKNSIKKFFEYIESASQESLKIGKRLLPWKFDCNIRKKDVIRNSDYIIEFLDLLGQNGVKIRERKQLLSYFPWNPVLWHSTL